MKNSENGLTNKGFSLLEVMIGSSLALVVGLGVMSYISTTRQTEDSLRSMQEFHDLVQRVSMALDDTKICSSALNLGFKTLGVNPLDLNSISVMNVDDPLAPPVTLAATNGASGDTLRIMPFQLKLKKSLGQNRHIANFSVRATKSQANMGAQQVAQDISLYVATNDTNQILFCYSIQNSPPANLQDLACHVTSDGMLYYNLKTHECADRYSKVYYDGTRTAASCPSTTAGIYPGKGACRSSIAPEDHRPEQRFYGDGSYLYAKPPKNYICDVHDPSVTCIYAQDAASSGAVCSVACKMDMLPSLIASGDAAPQ